MKLSRLFTLAVTFLITLGAATGAAQTVIVQHAPSGSGIEVVFNATSMGTATANAEGDATVTFNAIARENRGTTVRVAVEVCDTLRRVLLVEPGASAADRTVGCDRRDAPEVYVFRRVTTLVVDVERRDFGVLISQGPAPKEWLRHGPAPVKVWRQPPDGLVLMGGGGVLQLADARTATCGEATTCTGSARDNTVAAGLEYGFSRFISAQGSYVRPSPATTTGSGTGFRFSETRDTQFVTFAGKLGVPVGPVKLYGLAGGTYHHLLSTTTNTIEDVTLVVGGVSQTATGGTTTLRLRAKGWGWLFGGGVESWIAPRVAIFGEMALASLSSTNADGPEGGVDDRGTFAIIGAKVHVGLKR